MTLLKAAPIRQLSLQWDAEPRALDHHLDEWVKGSAVSPAIAELAVESIKGMHQVLGFLNPPKLGRNLGYVTRMVQEARTRYARPCRGGWLASGHAPLDDGRMVPVTYKPDQARLGDNGKEIKYERPAGSAPVPFFAPLDAAAVERIAARAGVTAPAFTSSWDAWCWLLAHPAVELVLDEGEKKAAAGCSHGWLTIGLAGIWNGCPKPKDAAGASFGSPTLIAELQWLRTVRPAGAPLTIGFDASDNPRGQIDIRNARRRLGRLLAEHGHEVSIREMPGPSDGETFIKGTDDLLAAGGPAALAALPVVPFDQWLKGGNQRAIANHLLHPFSTKHRVLRTVGRHFAVGDLTTTAPLVALVGGLGSNKTGAVAELARSKRLVSVTHRRSLADNQGLRFGLAVKREGQVLNAFERAQADLSQVASLMAEHEGFVTVADSSYVGGSGELLPEHCRGAVLFIDEADAFLRHALTSQTAIAEHRCQVLTNLAACVAAADQVLLAGAHIDELTLQAFEAMRDCRCTVIESTLQTAAERCVVMHRTVEQLLQQVRNLATHRQPFIFHTGSKQDGSKMSPINLARYVRRFWPDARVLVMTAETIRDPNHPSAAAIADPQRLLDFDVVLASPVLETGFNLEDPAGHFCAVLGHTSGHVMPQAFVQSLGRLRTGVSRHVWCNHTGVRIGNGAPVADEIERTKLDHAGRLALLHLLDAGDFAGDASRYVAWWSRLAADQNWLAGSYRHAVATLLEREGYKVQRLDLQAGDGGTELSDLLEEDRAETIAIETAAVAATPSPDSNQLELLEKRQRLTAEQRRQIERGRIERDLGVVDPTPQQVAASRNEAYAKFRQHLLVINPEARQQWRKHAAASLSSSQRAYAPDATRAMAPAYRADVLSAVPWVLELIELAGTGRTLIGCNFEQHHESAKAQSLQWRELFGFDPNSGTVRTFIANTLALLGFRLERTSRRERSGERVWWHYQVEDDLKPLDRQEVLQHLGLCHFPCK